MRCAEVRRLVDRYADERLAADRKLEVERHAAACVACRQLVAGAREVRRMLAAEAAGVRAPRGFADRVMDRVYRETLWQPVGRELGTRAAARGYRRLGLCVMLGTAALAACLVVPRVLNPSAAGAGLTGGASALVENVLNGADGAVRGALSAAGGSAARIVEGGQR